MTAQQIALENTTTMAPLKEAVYTPQNLTQKDSMLLGTISGNLIKNTDMVISALQSMMSNLKMYKEVMIDAINSESESIDLEVKYQNNPPRQIHTLPGITTLPPSYDIQEIKSDNDRFEQMKELRDKSEKQRDLYVKLLQQEFKMFSQSFRRMLYNDNTLQVFVESLNKKME
jgi:hypothetical protein